MLTFRVWIPYLKLYSAPLRLKRSDCAAGNITLIEEPIRRGPSHLTAEEHSVERVLQVLLTSGNYGPGQFV